MSKKKVYGIGSTVTTDDGRGVIAQFGANGTSVLVILSSGKSIWYMANEVYVSHRANLGIGKIAVVF